MYVGVDVGGTKTLLALFDASGSIKRQVKFPTPKDYADFLDELSKARDGLKPPALKAGAIAIPGRLDRQHGRAISLGNLPWKDVAVQADSQDLFDCPMVIENDAKLAGLSEANLLKGKYSRVCYLTVSTGIGYALVQDGVIDTSIGDGGGRSLLLEHHGQMIPWEDFAGGRAITKLYGKKAMNITDEATWRQICRDLAQGLVELIAVLEPEVIVVGGAVGAYFDRYGQLLDEEIRKHHLPMVDLPVLRQAARPEEAVVYGCYELAKRSYGNG